jgi:hypothetical protein
MVPMAAEAKPQFRQYDDAVEEKPHVLALYRENHQKQTLEYGAIPSSRQPAYRDVAQCWPKSLSTRRSIFGSCRYGRR